MTIKRLDHISVVVDDLESAIDFFTTLGLTIGGRARVRGQWVDRINALEGIEIDIVMMRTPDGHGQLELTKFLSPDLVPLEPSVAPPNALGLRSKGEVKRFVVYDAGAAERIGRPRGKRTSWFACWTTRSPSNLRSSPAGTRSGSRTPASSRTTSC